MSSDNNESASHPRAEFTDEDWTWTQQVRRVSFREATNEGSLVFDDSCSDSFVACKDSSHSKDDFSEKTEDLTEKVVEKVHEMGKEVDKEAENLTTLQMLSQATLHEEEAETKLLEAIEHHRQLLEKQQQQEAPSAQARRKRTVSFGTIEQKEFLDSLNAPPPPPLNNVLDTLAGTTQYLRALQDHKSEDNTKPAATGEGGEGVSSPQTDTRSKEKTPEDTVPNGYIVEPPPDFGLSSLDRIADAAPVLLAAASVEAMEDKLTQEPLPPDEPQETTTEEDVEASSNPRPPRHGFWALPRSARSAARRAVGATVSEFSSLHDFFAPKRKSILREFLFGLGFLVIPCLGVAALLFYTFDNPPTGRCRDGPCGFDKDGNPQASISYWIIFLGVRQVIVLWLARMADIFIMDWLLLQHAFCVRLLGPRFTLILVQSRGWPSVLFFWGLFDSMVLYGKGNFPEYWLFWQNKIALFTSQNPSGDIPTARWHRDMIIAGIVISVAVALKRNYVGLYLGQRIYSRFNERLQEAMKQITLVSELALWARRKRDQGHTYKDYLARRAYYSSESDDGSDEEERDVQGRASMLSLSTNKSKSSMNSDALAKAKQSLVKGEDIDYNAILDPWTEPERAGAEKVSGKHIIEFQQAFTVMTKSYFFSSAFGPVETRKHCISSSSVLFSRLLKLMGEEGTIDMSEVTRWMYKGFRTEDERDRAIELVKLFPADTDGSLDLLEFVKAIDCVYKEVRLLENAVHNASDINRGYEKVLNIFFYLVLGCLVLAIMGLDILTLILSLSTLIVAFSFMIGPGSAQVFEGIIFVLGRQPYDIGDKIAINNVHDQPGLDGHVQWMVEGVDLISTTCRLIATNEVASFSNGAISRSRIINMNKSPNALQFVFVRFPTDVPFSTIMVFKAAVQKFVEDRPLEWNAFLAFRNNRIEAQLNFSEYVIVLQHQLSWQNLLALRESKAAVASFCVELQKQMGCRYVAPSMPVELTIMTEVLAEKMKGMSTKFNSEQDLAGVLDSFR